MKLSVSAFRAQASAHKKILSTSWITPMNYGGSSSKDQTKVKMRLFYCTLHTHSRCTALIQFGAPKVEIFRICRPEPSKFSSFTCPGAEALRTRHSKSLQVLFIKYRYFHQIFCYFHYFHYKFVFFSLNTFIKKSSSFH